jgi:hypothetical protein
LLLLLLTLAPEARADPVVMTGSINFHSSPGPEASSFTLTGAGLYMNGTVSRFLLTTTRQSGQTYHLNGFFDDDLLFVQSPFTVDGITYTREWYTGEQGLFFASTQADFVIPTDPTLTEVSFSTPFTLTGFIDPKSRDDVGNKISVVGEGVATVSFYRSPNTGIGQTWFLNGFNYTFNAPTPTPEPSTLLLFGTGAAALGGRLLRKRRGRREG